jgi:hypothetical protein
MLIGPRFTLQVLQWDRATNALTKTGDTAAGRIELDEALDFRGNFYFNANACVGCATWARCFSMGTRWGLILGLMGFFNALGPFTFQASLKTLAPAKGGEPLLNSYACTSCLGMDCPGSALPCLDTVGSHNSCQ